MTMPRKYKQVCLLIPTRTDCEFSKVPRPSSLPAKVKTTFENTCAAVEPVLSGILMHAKDGMQTPVPLGPTAQLTSKQMMRPPTWSRFATGTFPRLCSHTTRFSALALT